MPKLAALTALAYGLGLIMVPVPGGTSGHALGVAMLTLLFGVRLAFLSYSLVLGLQSLLFGAGGITALPINALAMGLAGALVTAAVFLRLRGINETAAVAAAAWCSVMLRGLIVALLLGLQPLIAHRVDGTPLFFPFGFSIVLPAVLIPHVLIGVGEAVLTLLLGSCKEPKMGAGMSARGWLAVYVAAAAWRLPSCMNRCCWRLRWRSRWRSPARDAGGCCGGQDWRYFAFNLSVSLRRRGRGAMAGTVLRH